MNMAISYEEVQHVAKLARLDLDKEELLTFQSELNALLGYFEDIQAVSVDDQAVSHAVSLRNVFAEDDIHFGLTRDLALRSAPLTRGGLYVVPTMLEE
jgi:aspartyl-tRNA(Asn)/glutamyl-tRNA(Gln) amidotransferase subunit C